MKTILDKFEQSSIFVRIFLLLVLAGILVGGLFYSRQVSEQTQMAMSKKMSQTKTKTPEKKLDSSQADKEQEEIVKKAEEAVKYLEDNQSSENVAPAREATELVKDEAVKAVLETRIQAVEHAINVRAAEAEAAVTTTPSSATSSETPYVQQTIIPSQQTTYTQQESTTTYADTSTTTTTTDSSVQQ